MLLDLQEVGKVVWYFHFFKNFPQFVLIHTVKGFSVVSEVEVDVFLKLLLFLWSNERWQFGNLVLLPFLSPAYTLRSSWFMYCWTLAWKILSITLLACKMSTTVQLFEHSLTLPFSGTGMETDVSSLVATPEFSIFADILNAAL